ncbi:MAG TPA: WhiB family transcriptional regulator [Rugosimonospora sp.]|nr:WhiB family transcriptional regulator [Rugosimonospora sp.]
MADLFWRSRSLCRQPGIDPDWWSVDSTTLSPANLHAIGVCSICPVRDECEQTADLLDIRDMIVAGRVREYRIGRKAAA